MGNHRMFSNKIVESDAFLELPLSAQCLYFHLGMKADDDGALGNAKSITRIIGAKIKDLELLIEKNLLINFKESGVVVIRHWKINNYIKKDRKQESIYQDELSILRLDESGTYTLEDGKEINFHKERIPLTEAQEKRLQARKESDLPYSFGYKIRKYFIGARCPICNRVMSSATKYSMPTIQHNLPISKGGKHEISNISVICGECNYSLQDKETGPLNNDDVVRAWEEISRNDTGMEEKIVGNGTGMEPQDKLSKYNISKNNTSKANLNLEKEKIKEKENKSEYADELLKIHDLLENRFCRPLSPLEYDISNSWVLKYKYTFEDIKNALTICNQTGSNPKSIRYIDTVLHNEFDKNKEKAKDENEDNDLKEVIELSQIDWLSLKERDKHET